MDYSFDTLETGGQRPVDKDYWIVILWCWLGDPFWDPFLLGVYLRLALTKITNITTNTMISSSINPSATVPMPN